MLTVDVRELRKRGTVGLLDTFTVNEVNRRLLVQSLRRARDSQLYLRVWTGQDTLDQEWTLTWNSSPREKGLSDGVTGDREGG